MNGLLNVNKPSGMTSRRVVDIVARRAGTKRAGHAGTLDPLASGVLVICLGWATRLVAFLQDRPKTYLARFLLGRTSDTDDVTGELIEVPDAPKPPRAAVETALRAFVGEIMQVPPRFSAVHVAGRRAHKLARRGKPVQLEPRPVQVHRIDLIGYEFPELELEIECGSGTYIRSLARDLGNALGCGGVMSALVRQRSGDFSLATAATIEELATRPIAELLIPPLAAVADFPRYTCTPADLDQLTRGRPLLCPAEPPYPADAFVALLDAAGQLQAIAVFDAAEHLLRPRQVFLPGCSGKGAP
ncbi:MAG: tRNA pseudouridine(55) synthase TruB [Deltaproteobacteria bacterium]